MREVDIALKKISIRHHNAYAMRASLHGYKVPIMNTRPPADCKADPIDDQKAESAMAAALARKQQEVNRGKSK